ncbi:MAG: FkbM family methyltransferase [Acidiferrobacterales bacterium]|nr:FkbM family methyltransferase [Acidiferrobacterales bacterium]
MKKIFLKPLRDIAGYYYRSLGYYSLNKFGEQYRLDPYHMWLWRKVKQDKWEPETFDILTRFLEEDSIYCDIGAWIGTTSVLCAAAKCKHIYAIEPDKEAFRHLLWNIKLNNIENISSYNFALSEKTGVSRMAPFKGKEGDSTSSLIHKEADVNGTPVTTISWADFLKWMDLDRIDFIKIDIEGGEFDFLPSIQWYLDQYKPIVYLSTHAPYLDPGERKAAMEKIANTFAGYTYCRNSDMEDVGLGALTAPVALEKFRSFVFEP